MNLLSWLSNGKANHTDSVDFGFKVNKALELLILSSTIGINSWFGIRSFVSGYTNLKFQRMFNASGPYGCSGRSECSSKRLSASSIRSGFKFQVHSFCLVSPRSQVSLRGKKPYFFINLHLSFLKSTLSALYSVIDNVCGMIMSVYVSRKCRVCVYASRMVFLPRPCAPPEFIGSPS